MMLCCHLFPFLLLVLFCLPSSHGLVPHCHRKYPMCNGERGAVAPLNVEPITATAGAAFLAGGATMIWFSGSEEQVRKAQYAQYEAKVDADRVERARLAYVEPRGEGTWTLEEIGQYDGSDPTGPLLFAADGYVFNVWKSRHFYGPGCEYNIFAGQDATRLLAKSMLEEEDPTSAAKELTMAERAALAGWIWTFKGKYEIVGRLEGFDPKTTSMT